MRLPSSRRATFGFGGGDDRLGGTAGWKLHRAAQLAHDLNRDGHRFGDRQARVEIRPGFMGHETASGMQQRIHGFRQMRHHRCGQPRDHVQRLDAGRRQGQIIRGRSRVLLSLGQRACHFIEARHRDIEAEAFQRFGDGGDGAMRDAAQFPRGRRPRGRRLDLAKGRDRLRKAVEALGEAIGTGDARFRPFHIALGRIVGQDEPARGIGPVAVDDGAGVDRIALGFRHRLDAADRDRLIGAGNDGAAIGAVLDLGRIKPAAIGAAIALMRHHALGKETLERFRDIDLAARLHGAGKEARIEQMQNGVFDATDILVDRHPVISRFT